MGKNMPIVNGEYVLPESWDFVALTDSIRDALAEVEEAAIEVHKAMEELVKHPMPLASDMVDDDDEEDETWTWRYEQWEKALNAHSQAIEVRTKAQERLWVLFYEFQRGPTNVR